MPTKAELGHAVEVAHDKLTVAENAQIEQIGSDTPFEMRLATQRFKQDFKAEYDDAKAAYDRVPND